MGRGATLTPAKQQQGLDQAAQNSALQTRSQLGGALIPNLVAGLNSPGYDQATKNAINNTSLGALKSSYDSARQRAMNSAAATRNSAALIPGMDQMAQQEAAGMANQTANNQIQFANNAQQQEAQARAYLAQLYGDQTGLFGAGAGAGANTAGTLAKGTPPSFSFGWTPKGPSVGYQV